MDRPEQTHATAPPRRLIASPRRLALASLGVLCVALAVVGAVLPGLPTTIFLIAASFLFARSCPWLEQRLLGLRIFRPYLPYLEGEREMPRRARIVAMLAMWSAVTVSLTLTALAGRSSPWFTAGLLSAAVVGTVVIATIRRRPATAKRAGRRC